MIKILKTNLVFMSIDRGSISLTSTCPKDVHVNLKDGTWTVDEHRNAPSYFRGRIYKIGRDDRIAVQKYERYGIVGVYDKTKLTHLQNMIFDAEKATRDNSSPLDD